MYDYTESKNKAKCQHESWMGLILCEGHVGRESCPVIILIFAQANGCSQEDVTLLIVMYVNAQPALKMIEPEIIDACK